MFTVIIIIARITNKVIINFHNFNNLITGMN